MSNDPFADLIDQYDGIVSYVRHAVAEDMSADELSHVLLVAREQVDNFIERWNTREREVLNLD